MSVLDRLLTANEAYRKTLNMAILQSHLLREDCNNCVYGCKVDCRKCFRVKSFDAHIIRNAGGIATDDAIRSLLISRADF